MSFLCVTVMTGCKELIAFSSCISLLFRPATIIFMVKVTFSLFPQVLGSAKQSTFPDASTCFPRNDVWRSTTEIPYWWRVTVQIWIVIRHQYGNELLLQTPSSDLVSRGNQWSRRNMSAVLSYDQFLRLVSIRTKTLYRIKVILSLKFWIISFWVTAHLPLPYANILL